jgi:pyruvate formate lyase activating enzyme
MKVIGLPNVTMINYPRKIALEVYTTGCNYRCPACHARKLVFPEKEFESGMAEIDSRISSQRGWIDGITICGGEPTIQFGLKPFMQECRSRGLKTKLDTNGSDYSKLGNLLEEGLIDFVAMDVKGPFHLYARLTGQEHVDERDRFMKPMAVVSRNWHPGYEYEFRTTIVPIIRDNGEITWMTPEEAEEMARQIRMNSQDEQDTSYVIQKFVARPKEDMIDPRLSSDSLPEDMHQTPLPLMEKIEQAVRKYLPRARIR